MEAKNPLIKRLLISYSKSSGVSMNGPSDLKSDEANTNPVVTTPIANDTSLDKKGLQLKCALLTKRDHSHAELSETQLEDQFIACFDIGGEKRLCLIQIIKNILPDFSLGEITSVFQEFCIPSAVCSHSQLNMLKEKNVIPINVPHCGLVTKSDAQRFCSVLLANSKHQKQIKFNEIINNFDYKKSKLIQLTSFKVIHKCFGGCQGIFYQKLFNSTKSECVECSECKCLLTPQKFVTHFHSTAEYKQTCHWGFDSSNWKHYLKLDPRENPDYYDVLTKLFAYNDSDQQMLYEIQNKSYKTEDSADTLCFSDDIQPQQILSDEKERKQNVAPPLMYDQPTILPQIRHEPGEIPPNISLLPSDKFNGFNEHWNEEYADDNDVSMKPYHNTSSHYQPNIKTVIKSEILDIGTGDDDIDDVDDDNETNYEAVMRAMQKYHDEGSTLFREALNRRDKDDVSENVDEKEKLYASFCEVTKKYDNIVMDLLFQNNKLNIKKDLIRTKETTMMNPNQNDCNYDMESTDEAHDHNNVYNNETQTSFINYNDYKHIYNNNNNIFNECNSTKINSELNIFYSNNGKYSNMVADARLCCSVSQSYIRAMTAPGRRMQDSSQPNSHLKNDIHNINDNNNINGNNYNDNITIKNDITCNNDNNDEDHYQEEHVLKKRKRCHTFAGNSVRLVS